MHSLSPEQRKMIYNAARTHLRQRAAVQPVCALAPDILVDDETYERIDAELLQIFDQRGRLWWLSFWRTGYVHVQRSGRKKGFLEILRWTHKYWRVFSSIKHKGYVVRHPNESKAYPWAFHSEELTIRNDGHHRAAAARYLQVKDLPTRVAIPSELLASAHVPPEVKELISQLNDPADVTVSTSEQGATLVISSLRCGGAERIMSGMANYWVAQGRPVTLITMSGPESDFYSLLPEVNRVALHLDKPATCPYSYIAKRWRRVTYLRAAIREAGHRTVIAFTTNISTLAILAAYRTPSRVVAVERNDPIQRKVSLLARIRRRILYPHAWRVVVQTERVRKVWGPFVEDRLKVIPNFIETSGPQSPPSSEFKKPFILGVGRLVQRKGFDTLIAAFSEIAEQFPDWYLVILGEGPDRVRLEEQMAQTGRADRVLLPGRRSDVEQVYEAADIFVLSSLFEGFPNVLLEAMRGHCAVVSTDCPSGPSEVIQDGENGFLVPLHGQTAMRDRLSQLMRDSKLRTKLAVNARRDVERFSLEHVISSWTELLDETS